MSGKLFS
jgi:hypothetical protein